jgi:hypothetical protein
MKCEDQVFGDLLQTVDISDNYGVRDAPLNNREIENPASAAVKHFLAEHQLGHYVICKCSFLDNIGRFALQCRKKPGPRENLRCQRESHSPHHSHFQAAI